MAEKQIKKSICEAFGYVVPFEHIIRQHLCAVEPEPAPEPEPILASEAPMDELPVAAEPVPVEVSITKTVARKRAKIVD
jgi:hypothetical protein